MVSRQLPLELIPWGSDAQNRNNLPSRIQSWTLVYNLRDLSNPGIIGSLWDDRELKPGTVMTSPSLEVTLVSVSLSRCRYYDQWGLISGISPQWRREGRLHQEEPPITGQQVIFSPCTPASSGENCCLLISQLVRSRNILRPPKANITMEEGIQMRSIQIKWKMTWWYSL